MAGESTMESGTAPSDNPMEARIARLESDVSHIQTDVADMKVDLRSLRDKLDDLSVRFSGKFDELRGEMHSTRVWGFGLFITMTGTMLTVMARGFGWL